MSTENSHIKKKKMVDPKKICFASSSGGHFEQISMLKPMMDKYDSIVITEKTRYSFRIKGVRKYYLVQVNRKEILMPVKMILNSFISLWMLMIEKPEFVISTGALSVVPLCLLAKLMGKKLIFIESFANIVSPSGTGKFIYRFADRFYVQWETMKKFYPDAIYLGGIY